SQRCDIICINKKALSANSTCPEPLLRAVANINRLQNPLTSPKVKAVFVYLCLCSILRSLR
ncbi:MAG: hypothetical protein M3Z48_13470, partial [Lactobacillus sp.]|nr:hypothetical protein [Lactobacillus sp.]